MPSNYYSGYFLPDVKRVRQITSAHCGPAVLEMLLSKLGISVSQTQVAEAAGVAKKIATHGMTLAEMHASITNLFPDLTFWWKFNSSLADLRSAVELYHYPVGVEWQGEFDHEDDDGDPGHYGAITHVNTDEGFLLLADPYYPIRDRKFKLDDFRERWWDINEVKDPPTGEKRKVYDSCPMFVITPNSVDFPRSLNMNKGIPEVSTSEQR